MFSKIDELTAKINVLKQSSCHYRSVSIFFRFIGDFSSDGQLLKCCNVKCMNILRQNNSGISPMKTDTSVAATTRLWCFFCFAFPQHARCCSIFKQRIIIHSPSQSALKALSCHVHIVFVVPNARVYHHSNAIRKTSRNINKR